MNKIKSTHQIACDVFIQYQLYFSIFWDLVFQAHSNTPKY